MKMVEPIDEINAVITVPGSKSYTQRALVTACLARGHSVVRGALISQDTRHLIEALRQLGAHIAVEADELSIAGTGGDLVCPPETILMGNNGTGLRLLTAVAALSPGTVVIDGDARMRQRPIQPLVEALKMLNVEATCVNDDGCPPVEVSGPEISAGRALLDAEMSSQFLSALLLAVPYAAGDVTIELKSKLASQPYVAITMDVMNRFGVPVVRQDDKTFFVRAPRTYQPLDYVVEGDVSSATYFMAAAAICGGTICIANIRKDSLQGDLRFGEILHAFGCRVELSNGGLTVEGPLSIHDDMQFDLADCPDMVPALAVVSAFRRGRTQMRNIGHLRIKECDRISALASELKKIGAAVDEEDDHIAVRGVVSRGGEIECFDDHRIAMSFAVAGLAVPGISIKDPACVAKSFPNFWEKLESLKPRQETNP